MAQPQSMADMPPQTASMAAGTAAMPGAPVMMPPQAVQQMAAEPAPALTIDQIILQEHNKVRHLFNEYAKAADRHMKQQLAYLIIREISMHSCKEEQVMYPVIGKLFGPDAQMHCLEEHRSMKLKLEQLNNMSVMANEDACDELVAAIKLEFEQHGMEEETREIPRLMQAPGIDPMDLAMQFQQAAAMAPTRPHPEAPDMPPQNIQMAPMLHDADVKADMSRFGGSLPVMTEVPQVTPTYQMA